MIRLYVDDTLHLDVRLVDTEGQALDLTDATVSVLSQPAGLDGDATVLDPVDGHIEFTRAADTAGIFSLRYRIEWATAGIVATEPGDTVRVLDPAAMWATVGDIEAIYGPVDPEQAARAIDAAMALIMSWLCTPVPDPLPPEFTMATTILAGRIIQMPTPGSPIAETIGDYSYRLAGPADPEGLRAEIRHLLGPWLCGTIHSVRVWPSSGGCGCPEAAWAWQLYLDCFDSVDGFTDGFQPDAEGFVRG